MNANQEVEEFGITYIENERHHKILGQRVPRALGASALARLELLIGQQGLVVAKIIRAVFLNAVQSVYEASFNVRSLVCPVPVAQMPLDANQKTMETIIQKNIILTCLCRALRLVHPHALPLCRGRHILGNHASRTKLHRHCDLIRYTPSTQASGGSHHTRRTYSH